MYKPPLLRDEYPNKRTMINSTVIAGFEKSRS